MSRILDLLYQFYVMMKSVFWPWWPALAYAYRDRFMVRFAAKLVASLGIAAAVQYLLNWYLEGEVKVPYISVWLGLLLGLAMLPFVKKLESLLINLLTVVIAFAVAAIGIILAAVFIALPVRIYGAVFCNKADYERIVELTDKIIWGPWDFADNVILGSGRRQAGAGGG